MSTTPASPPPAKPSLVLPEIQGPPIEPHAGGGGEGRMFALVGKPSAGKTVAGLTLPRPTLFLALDLNVPDNVRGFPGVNWIEFFPEDQDIEVSDARDLKAPGRRTRPTVLDRFRLWSNATKYNGMLDRYASVVLDSVSALETATFEYHLFERGWHDRVLEPQETGTLAKSFRLSVLRPTIARLRANGRYVLLNFHLQEQKDGGGFGKTVSTSFRLVGSSRDAVSEHLGEIYTAKHIPGSGPEKATGEKWVFYTRPVGSDTIGRSGFKAKPLPAEINAMIPKGQWDRATEFGLGGLIRDIEAGKYAVAPEEESKE